MKKFKSVLCLIVIFAMLMQCGAFAMSIKYVSFAESEPDENGVRKITSGTFISGADADNNAELITAVYDAQGKVVSANKAGTSNSSKLLTNSVTATEGQTVKSFVWDPSKNPLTTPAVMGDAITEEDVEITFDGIDFETFMGKPLSFDESHTTEYVVSYKDKAEIYTPDVSVKVKNNALKPVVKKEALKTTINIYGGNRIAIDDPTNAGQVENKDGEMKNKWVYASNGKEELDQSYTYPLCETIIIHYDDREDTSYWTEEDLVFSGDCGVWYGNAVQWKAEKKYSVPEGQTKDITLTLSGKSMEKFLVIKAKDNTKDVLVNADGSAITWTRSAGNSTSSTYHTITDYNYRLNEDGSRDFSQGFEGNRATGVEYCTTPVKATNGNAFYYYKDTHNSDDDYIFGSILVYERSAMPGTNRMEYTNIPDEYLGENYIAMPKLDQSNVTFTITVNDNIDSIAMFSTSNNTASYNIKDSEDEAVWAFTKGNFGTRRYQNNVSFGTYAFLYSIGIDGAKEIRAGRYLRYNLLKQMKATYGANIVKLKDTADYVNAKDFNTMTTAEYGSKTLHNDYKKIGSREVKKIINNFRMEYDAYVDYYNNVYTGTNGLLADLGANYTSKVMDFEPHMASVYADREGYKNIGGTGALLRYPAYFNFENAEYVGTNLNWQNTSSSFTEYYKDTKNYGNPLLSFELGKDATVMVVYQHPVRDGSPLSAAGNQGWSYFTLPFDDSIKVMEKSISWTNADARPSIGTYFHYDDVYTKKYRKGETFTLPTAGTGNGAPLIFVMEDFDMVHEVTPTDIKINGVSLDGFDVDTLEYNYTLSDEEAANPAAPVITVDVEDPGCDIDVVYDKTFPGGATVKVSHYTGAVSKTYKINFVYDVDMVYDLVMCNNNQYVYTALREETTKEGELISSGNQEYTVKFTDAAMGNNNNTIAEYVKGGVKVGELGYTDRPNYKIKSIADESYIGKDRIVGSIGWYNGDIKMKAAFQGVKMANTNGSTSNLYVTPLGETYIPNWLNFKTKRGATVKVCNIGTIGNYSNLAKAGFDTEAVTTARFVIDINGNDRNQTHIAYKHTDANTQMSVPNAHSGDSAYSVVLFYDDWE